jgi:hypothetical protein
MGTKLFDHMTLTLMFDQLIKKFNLGYNVQIVCTKTLIFHECSLWQILFMGTKMFEFVTLTFMFDLLIKKFNLAYNIWIICTRALIIHMSVPYGKTFPWVPDFLTMWPWPWCLTYLLKTLTLAITFKWYILGWWYFTWVFLVTRSFHRYQNIWPCDFDLNIWPTY